MLACRYCFVCRKTEALVKSYLHVCREAACGAHFYCLSFVGKIGGAVSLNTALDYPTMGWKSSLHPGGLLHQLHDFWCETGRKFLWSLWLWNKRYTIRWFWCCHQF